MKLVSRFPSISAAVALTLMSGCGMRQEDLVTPVAAEEDAAIPVCFTFEPEWEPPEPYFERVFEEGAFLSCFKYTYNDHFKGTPEMYRIDRLQFIEEFDLEQFLLSFWDFLKNLFGEADWKRQHRRGDGENRELGKKNKKRKAVGGSGSCMDCNAEALPAAECYLCNRRELSQLPSFEESGRVRRRRQETTKTFDEKFTDCLKYHRDRFRYFENYPGITDGVHSYSCLTRISVENLGDAIIEELEDIVSQSTDPPTSAP